MRYLFLILLLVGCGESVPSGGVDSAESTGADTLAKKESTSEDNLYNGAYLVQSKADLWKCVEAIHRQLVYIEEEELFYYCSTKTSEWTQIGLKGDKGDKGDVVVADGKDGKDGTDGVAGQDGKDGKDGAQGPAGRDGKDAPIATEEMFIHPIDGTRWFLGSSITISNVTDDPTREYNATNLKSFCSKGARFPTEEEFKDAMRAGLWERFKNRVPDGMAVGIGSPYQALSSTINLYYVKIGRMWGEISITSQKTANLTVPILCIADPQW